MAPSSTTIVARLNGDELQHLDHRLNRSLAARKSYIQKQVIEVSSVSIDAVLSVVPAKHKWLLFKKLLPALPAKATLSVELVPKTKQP